MPVLPAFEVCPLEGQIIGKMLAGYGEIELEMAWCASEALNETEAPIKACYRGRGEKQRIDIADAFIRPVLADTTIETFYAETVSAVHNCRTIRNRYAHCHWLGYKKEGLFFTNLEEAAKKNGPLQHSFRHVDVPLLLAQERYFDFTYDSLRHIADQIRKMTGRSSHDVPKPSKIDLPPAHNPREKHPLPA